MRLGTRRPVASRGVSFAFGECTLSARHCASASHSKWRSNGGHKFPNGKMCEKWHRLNGAASVCEPPSPSEWCMRPFRTRSMNHSQNDDAGSHNDSAGGNKNLIRSIQVTISCCSLITHNFAGLCRTVRLRR